MKVNRYQMSSGLRASGFQSTHDDTTFNSQLSNMVNVKMNNLKQQMQMGMGSGNIHPMNFSNNNSRLSDYPSGIGVTKRQGSTLTNVGNQMVNYGGFSAMGSNGRPPNGVKGMHNTFTGQINRSQGPSMAMKTPFGHQANTKSIQLFKGGPPQDDNKHLSFRDAWRKAIEKYSPKKPTRLNEVSFRF